MHRFQDEADLEEYLSRPYAEDIAAAEKLNGDVVLLGAGGKMGPTLALRIRRALDKAGQRHRVIAVSRFTDRAAAARLENQGIKICGIDLLHPEGPLPEAPNVIYLAGRKFGSSGSPGLTWMMNVVLPERIAAFYRHSRIAALSSGNIYPLRRVAEGGATEQDEAGPVGEYAQTVLGRERIFEYHAELNQTAVVILRLNYAVEPRYGVLVDLAEKIWRGETIDLTMGYVNVIWQGDANSYVLRSLSMASAAAPRLNLAGMEILRVRDLAEALAQRLQREVHFAGTEAPTALLNNATECARLYGPPPTELDDILDATAHWILDGHATLGKPTHFEARDGKF
jgi:nucleoside-diphosphate-sugar epimerase